MPFDLSTARPEVEQAPPRGGFDLSTARVAAPHAGTGQAPPAPTPAQEAPASSLRRGLGAVNRYVADPILGAAETAATMATGAAGDIAGRAAGLAAIPVDLAGVALGRRPGETADPAAVRDSVAGAITWRPRTESAQALMRTVAAPFERFEQSKDQLQDIVTDATGSTLAGDLAKAGANASQAVLEFVPGVGAARALRAGRPVEVPGSAAFTREEVAARSRVPTKDDLGDAARAAYQRAEQAGVVITPESMAGFKAKAATALKGIDPTLHPNTTAALRRITDTEGPVTLEQMETLRRIAKDAQAGAANNPPDRRLAAMLEDSIDEYMDALKPADIAAGNAKAAVQALQEARNLYSRNRKAQVVEDLMARAQIRASQFSGSGLENAIRTEFRQLALNPRRMRTFTAEEQAAIRGVARGGPIENALRYFGKLAPTGVVSGALSGGLGALVAGGPGAVALPALGFASRAGATHLQGRKVQRVSELMRRGPPGSVSPEAMRLVEALRRAQ